METISADRAETWLEVGALEDIPYAGARVVVTPHGNVAVFRTGDNRVFALLDRCPHRGGPLSQGIVFGQRVACPLHNWVIDLENGAAVAPDEGCTNTFPVRVSNGIVYLGVTPQRVGG